MTVKELINVLRTKDQSALVVVQRAGEWRELVVGDVSIAADPTCTELMDGSFMEEEHEDMAVVSFDSWS